MAMPTAEPFATENMAVGEYILGQARIEFTRAEGQSLACRTQSLDKVLAELGAKPANHSQIKRGTAAACTARRGMQGHEVGEISLWLVDERQRRHPSLAASGPHRSIPRAGGEKGDCDWSSGVLFASMFRL